MPRLEDSLLLLAGQDELLPTEQVIDRIERNLGGENQYQVVALITPPTTDTDRVTEPAWRRPVLAVSGAAAVLLLLVAVPLLLFGGTDSVSEQPVSTNAVPPTPSGPLDVEFTLDLLLNLGPAGTFTVAGSAADAGLVCAEGNAVEFPMQRPDQSFRLQPWETELTCADGNRFIVLTTETATGERPDSVRPEDGLIEANNWYIEGTWKVVSGTGNLASLTGDGTYHGECRHFQGSFSCVQDYTGWLALES